MSALGDIAASISKGVNLGTLGKIAKIGGTITETVGQITGGISEEKRGRALASGVMRRASYEAWLRRRQGKRLKSKQQALLAKSGVEMTGTPLLVMEETIREAELDALMIEAGGKAEASQYRATGRAAKTAGFVSGGTTFLTNLSSLLRNPKKKIPTPKVIGPWGWE